MFRIVSNPSRNVAMAMFVLLLGVIAIAPVMAVPAHASDPKDTLRADWVTMIDILQVTDVGAARDYAKWVDGIAQQHGVEVTQVYEVLDTPYGDLNAQIVFLMRAPSNAEMGAMANDREYKKKIKKRDRIFNMATVQRLILEPIIID